MLENRAGAPTLLSRRRMTAELPIEKVGARLREMMPWIRKNRLVDHVAGTEDQRDAALSASDHRPGGLAVPRGRSLLSLASQLGWLGLVVAAAVARPPLFVLQFFRDPPREVPDDPRAVLSPADGRVVRWSRQRTTRTSSARRSRSRVFMNVFNVHSNRAPVDGTVKKRWYLAGAFLNAALDKASLENERNALWLQTARRRRTSPACRSPGLIARRILCYVEPGARAGARTALRLHPLRLARGRVPAAGRARRRPRSATRCTLPRAILAMAEAHG